MIAVAPVHDIHAQSLSKQSFTSYDLLRSLSKAVKEQLRRSLRIKSCFVRLELQSLQRYMAGSEHLCPLGQAVEDSLADLNDVVRLR